MRKHFGEIQSRRELFIGTLRYATLALMASGGVALFAKRYRLVREGKCINEGICAGCKVLKNCSLPKAVSAKRILTEIDNDR